MSQDARGQTALITGCSTGIGRATAERLHDEGLVVYATARKVETLDELKARGIRVLPLDVTDEQSMADAVAAVEDEAGPVEVLVNNAGYGLYGPVEQLPMDEIRRQFETNFFGLVRMIQLVLPSMRAAEHGRILNVSSMGGRITLPGGAFYHASKHAVEALSDALRFEVKSFGIDVVLIEPGPVKTPWNDVAAASISAATMGTSDEAAEPEGDIDDPYAVFKSAVGSSFGAVTRGGAVSKLSSSSDDIAKVIAKAVTARRPRTRYLINPIAKGFVAMGMLPDRVYDAALRRQYGLN
jgi:NAD(P)-dependent dehydrogenase (short-subunit alcohol dehydrogenase family)